MSVNKCKKKRKIITEEKQEGRTAMNTNNRNMAGNDERAWVPLNTKYEGKS